MSELAHGRVVPGRGIARVLTDDRLCRRATEGDEAAFAEIFRRYHQRLYRYCLAILGNPQDAQDALQNAMVKAMGALAGEERRIDLKPWLYRVAHNEAIDMLRRRRETAELDAEQASPAPGLAEEAAARQRLRELIADLDELPDRQRGALVMRELAGLEFTEIGSALGTSSAVARQTLYEARLSLGQMNEGRDMSCREVTRALSDGDGRVTRRRDIRAHLRGCRDCRRFGEEIGGRERDLAALAPLPAVAAAGILQGLLGGSGTGGGGLAAALGGGAAKSAGIPVALKGAATVAVVAAIGVTAADRGGLIETSSPADGAPAAGEVSRAASAAASAGPGSGAVAGAGAAARDGRDVLPGRVAGDRADATPGALGAPLAEAGAEGADGESAAPIATSDPSGESRGKGHTKELPAASAHGQQTAAEHKSPGKGSSGHPAHPAHPDVPAHSTRPPHSAAPGASHPQPPPGQEKKPPTEASPTGAAESHSQGGGHAAPGSTPAQSAEPESAGQLK